MPEQESRPTVAELEQEFDDAMASAEFRRFREKEAEIRSAFLTRRPALSDSLNDAIMVLAEHRRRLDANSWSLRNVIATAIRPLRFPTFYGPWPWVTGLVIITILIGATFPTLSIWYLLIGSGLALLMVTSAWSITEGVPTIEQRRLETKEEFRVAEASYSTQLTHAARGALRRCVTDVYRPTGVLVFPMTAPTLVELSSGKISSSRTHDEVVDFIRNHETSAIGIAGPRGAGKSTLMEAVRNTEDVVTHHVLLTAPVKYDPVDFTRQLFAQVAEEIARKSGYSPEREQEARDRRFRTQRAMRDALTLGLFLMLACVVFLWAISHNDTWAWEWQTVLGLAATGLLVLVVITPMASILLFGARSSRTRYTYLDVQKSAQLAMEALDDLTWSREEGKKESSSIKLLSGLLTLGGEDNVTRKRRERSQPELVTKFRDMLTQFSRDRTDPATQRFVVFIDELDKLARVDDLTEAVNGIKDLMHIPGVHFVVSVSVDALVQFEQRGMAARDAFDSTFDTVFRMRGLTLAESRDILEGRVANFPTVLTHGCHVWSGGLARDLLRTARRCVEIHRRDGNVAQIMRTAVTEDLLALIDNALRVPDAPLDHLCELRQAVLTVAEGNADPRRRTPGPAENSNQVAYVVAVGLALLSCFHGWAPDDNRWERPPKWDDCMEALAAAMSARADPPVIRDRALRKAKALVQATM